MKTYRSWICRIILTVVFAAIGLLAFRFAHEMWLQASLGPQIQTDFGFNIGTPYVDDGSYLGDEPIEIVSLTTDSPLAEAGVSAGDYLAENLSISQFYRLLRRSESEPVSIRFVTGGGGVPIADRPIKTVTIDVQKQIRQNGAITNNE